MKSQKSYDFNNQTLWQILIQSAVIQFFLLSEINNEIIKPKTILMRHRKSGHVLDYDISQHL